VRLFAFTSLLADVSSEMLYPLTPLFLTVVLRAPVAAVGGMEGAAEAVASLLKIWSGGWSDRARRRMPMVVGGYALSSAARPLLGVVTAWPQAVALRVGDRVGKGLRTSPRDSLIVDATEEGQRGRAFGFHRAADSLGAVLGPLLALVLLAAFHGHMRPVFLVAAIPGALSLIPLLAVKEKPRPAEHRRGGEGPPLGRRYWWFIAVVAVFGLGNSTDALILLRAKGLGMSTSMVVLAYVAYNVVYATLAWPLGSRGDRVGKHRVLGMGFAVFAVVYAGLALIHSSALIWPLLAVYGVYAAATEGVARALVADLAPAGRRGLALGVYHGTVGVLALVAGTVGGVMFDSIGPWAPFALGAGTAAAACLILLAWRKGPGAAPITRASSTAVA